MNKVEKHLLAFGFPTGGDIEKIEIGGEATTPTWAKSNTNCQSIVPGLSLAGVTAS